MMRRTLLVTPLPPASSQRPPPRRWRKPRFGAIAALVLVALVTIATSGVLPGVSAGDSCDTTYCCNEDPVTVVVKTVDRGAQVVDDALSHTVPFIGKARCVVLEQADVCGEQDNLVSPGQPFSTGSLHPNQAYCVEFITPGYESMFGCGPGQDVRIHRVNGGLSDTHTCELLATYLGIYP